MSSKKTFNKLINTIPNLELLQSFDAFIKKVKDKKHPTTLKENVLFYSFVNYEENKETEFSNFLQHFESTLPLKFKTKEEELEKSSFFIFIENPNLKEIQFEWFFSNSSFGSFFYKLTNTIWFWTNNFLSEQELDFIKNQILFEYDDLINTKLNEKEKDFSYTTGDSFYNTGNISISEEISSFKSKIKDIVEENKNE
ncbi:MAG: hypothetical protein ACRC4M_05200 [Mycoplasma sp.]